MYHISNDIRSKKSAENICSALLDYAGRVPFEEITVAGLHKNYLISRTTFYRLFDNTVDVLEYMVDNMAREILLNLKGDTTKELVIDAISGLMKRQELILLLFRIGRLDLFCKKGEEFIPQSRIAPKESAGAELFYKFLAYLIPIFLEIWIKNGQKDSPEDLYVQICQGIHILDVWLWQ